MSTSRDIQADGQVVIKKTDSYESLDVKEDYNQLHPTISFAPFPGWTLINSKSGGANSAGPYGGEYRKDFSDEEGEQGIIALFKRDTDLSRELGNQVRVDKVMAERLGEILINTTIEHIDEKKKIKVAKTKLVKANEASLGKGLDDGENTYLQSIFIENYKGDLWKYAYQKHYEKKYYQKLEKKSPEETAKIKEIWRKELIKKYQAVIDREKNESLKFEGDKKKHINNKIEKLSIKISNINNEMSDGNSDAAVVRAKYETDLLKRPSAILPDRLQKMFSPILGVPSRPRQVVNRLIKENENLKYGFIKSVAARLLVADFGLHNANFGVIEQDKELLFANLDYGAAFDDFSETVEPFTRRGELVTAYHKNHFLEYSNKLIKSEAMAKSFIDLDDPSLTEEFEDNIDKRIDEYGKIFTIAPLKKFCQRLKMRDYEKYNESEKDNLLANMKKFLKSRIASRQDSLKKQGYGLLLEHCVNEKMFSRSIEETKVNELLHEYPEIKEYIKSSDFKNYIFQYRSSLDLVRQRELKNAIAKACGLEPIYPLPVISPIVKSASTFFSPPASPSSLPQPVKMTIDEIYPSLSGVRNSLAVFENKNSKEAKKLAKITDELIEIYKKYNIKY